VNSRLVTFGFALGALALFYVLLFPPPSPPSERVTRPQSTEPGPNGYLALSRWLDANGVEPVHFRERFTRIGSLEGLPPAGNLLVSTAPHLYPLRDTEIERLHEWIAAGNTLLMVTGLSDTPEWSIGARVDPASFFGTLHALTGMGFEVNEAPDASEARADVDAEAGTDTAVEAASDEGETADAAAEGEAPERSEPSSTERLDPPQQFEMVSNGTHPLLEEVRSVVAISEYPTAKWRTSDATSADLVLELAHDPESGAPVLWLVRLGSGQIIVSAYGSIFVNKLLGRQDNARLLANVVQWSVGPRGRVLIDDAHQGLVAFYDPEAFFGDPRLHATLWWLLGLWFVFVLGSQRMLASVSRLEPVDVTSFVRASGGFLARVLKPATAAERLIANFQDEVRRGAALPAEAPVWEWLEGRPDLPRGDLERLRELQRRAVRRDRVDLPAVQNLLTRLRSRLT
jgi:hypothetical protein